MRRVLELQSCPSLPVIGAAPGLYEYGGALYVVQAINMPPMYMGSTNQLPVVALPDQSSAADPLVVVGITPDHLIKLAAVLMDPANAPQLYTKVPA